MPNDFEEEIPVVDDTGQSNIIKAKNQTWASRPRVKDNEIPSLKDMIQNEEQAGESFILSQEQKEIENLKQRQVLVQTAEEDDIDYESIAKEIVKKSGMVLKNKALRKRLIVNLKLYLREVKKLSDLKDALLKKTKHGGLGFKEDKIQKILNVAKKIKPKRLEPELEQKKGASDIKLTYLPQKQEVSDEGRKKDNDLKSQTSGSSFVSDKKKEQDNNNNMKKNNNKEKDKKNKKFNNDKKQKFFNKKNNIKNKKKNNKVFIKSRDSVLVDPVKELEYSLIDFRRLSAQMEKKVEIILNKIDYLKQQSFGNKILGIKAWYNSEVCRQYLKMVQDALFENKNLDKIIKLRQEKEVDTLTLDEFKAVVEINKALRF
jgi:hypothetical protein